MTEKNNAGSGEWVDPDDAPQLTEEFFAQAEMFEGNTFVKRGRGRPAGATGNAKELISVRLSREVLTKLREAGPGWQSQVEKLLRQALGLAAQSDPVHMADESATGVVGGVAGGMDLVVTRPQTAGRAGR